MTARREKHCNFRRLTTYSRCHLETIHGAWHFDVRNDRAYVGALPKPLQRLIGVARLANDITFTGQYLGQNPSGGLVVIYNENNLLPGADLGIRHMSSPE